MPQRGDRVAPPARQGRWELRHTGAADAWEKLVANVPSAALNCYDTLSVDPLAYSSRQKQLRGELARRLVGGRELPQWQFEVTSGGRVWYCPDIDRRVVWITEVHLGPPKQTHRSRGAG